MNDRLSTTCSEVIDFGHFRLVPSARTLTRNGVPVHLGDRALDVLIALVQRRGEVVSKRELFEAVWPGTVVEESNLRVNVAALRKALGDGQLGSRYVANIPGRGYTFIGKVQHSGIVEDEVAPPVPAQSGGRTNVPASLNRIIGRDQAVARISGQLPVSRFVTITGAGGIGKTAVALAVADRIVETYRDGVHLLDLATLTDPNLVVSQLASMLRLPTMGSRRLDNVVAHLRTRNLLLVLDNCEHLVDVTSAIAEEILTWAAEVHVLATSREALRASGEWVERLAPLASPPEPEKMTLQQAIAFSAVRLFVERTLARDASFKITDAEVPVIADLCKRLDGLPLAIELAAARVLLFGVRGVADRLDDRFNILTKGRRTAVSRHQTLAAMIDWSYQALPAHERMVWRRLSVFAGTFTLEGAAVIGLSGSIDHQEVIDVLDSLVEKSLIAVDMLASEARYRMLESLRLYASAKLLENDESDGVRRCHAEYFCRRSSGSGDNWLDPPTTQWLESHSGDVADIRAAIKWAFSADTPVLAIKLIGASAPFWFKLLLVPELRGFLEHALRVAPGLEQIGDELLMRLHFALAHSIYHTRGSVHEVSRALEEALSIADRRRDVDAQLQILWARFGTFATYGYYKHMLPSVERVHGIMTECPEMPVAPLYNRMAALTYHLLGAQQTALRHAELALHHDAVNQRASRDGVFVYDHKTATSAHFARILWVMGRPDSASEIVRATLANALSIDQPFARGFFLVFAAFPISFWIGDMQAARKHASLLVDVASGITFNFWRAAGLIYRQVLDYFENDSGAYSAMGQKLLGDDSLTPFLMDTLATFSWQLSYPRSTELTLADGVHWCTAEILRGRGEQLLCSGRGEDRQEAERLFVRSIEISRDQQALSWELRCATSLARLWQADRRTLQAADLLAGVYQRFTEGFATRDLIDAKALLDIL